MVRNFNSQMYAVQALNFKDGYEVYEYNVTDISGTNSVMVSRKYRREGHKNLYYSECFIVGPRGGRKEVYSNMCY